MVTRHLRLFEIATAILGGLLVLALASVPAFGQLATNTGIANRAVGRLTDLNYNGPGYLYYGVNGADRGLGYIGSYMTLGGFIPLAEDDLGGIWNADIRSHLSVYGGFFSNVGAVRKQMLGGGSLLGVGVYWDYDGDLDQYASETSGSPFGNFGHVYNQVGVSGELLTDWGNLRSNGYIPVGQTGHLLASSSSDAGIFLQNYILARNGLDAALGGADLELGAYLPGLADWAGMINVGGYAFGNGRYIQSGGPDAGSDLVPWFGGVYTRLDLTLARNWDFSLQYNNDTFFDSTGFARLTYRMGGSRRRNVPDQMEQPMFRNEHIVRAHETPIIAVNPQNNNTPWQVVHVDNSALPGGDGTAEAPFQTLAEAQGSPIVQNQEWAITYIRPGTSAAAGNIALNPYTGSFSFQQPNQFLIGSGGDFTIATQPIDGQSLLTIPALTSTNPVLSNIDSAISNGASVVVSGGNGGATVANLNIYSSVLGIDASGNLSSGALNAQPLGTTANPFGTPLSSQGGSAVRKVSIVGNGSASPQRGIQVSDRGAGVSGDIEFSDTEIIDSNTQAIQIADGNADVDFTGRIRSNVTPDFEPLIFIDDTTGGNINLASTSSPIGATIPNEIFATGSAGILIQDNASATNITIGNLTLVNPFPTAVSVLNDSATTSISTRTQGSSTVGITKNAGNATIAITGGGPTLTFNGTVSNSTSTRPNGPIIGISNTTGADIDIGGPGLAPLQSVAGGIQIQGNNDSLIAIEGAALQGSGSAAGIIIGGASGSGDENINNTQTNLSGLTIDLPATAGRGLEAINAGVVYTTGTNSLTTQSASLAAIYANGDTTLFGPNSETLSFNTLSSANATEFGTITGITLTTQGTGYLVDQTALVVDLSSPPLGFTTATGTTVTDAGGVVTDLTLTSGGSGYVTSQIVDLLPTDGTAVTTAATATVDTIASELAITLNLFKAGTTVTTGVIDMGTFTVDGVAGSGNNVLNNGSAVTVNAAGTQISP